MFRNLCVSVREGEDEQEREEEKGKNFKLFSSYIFALIVLAD